MKLEKLKHRKIKYWLLLSLALLIALIILSQLEREVDNSLQPALDLTDHPIYSGYDFDQNGTKIKLGIQPLYLPTGIIFEAIKRDLILKTAVAQAGKEIEYLSFSKGADVNYFLKRKMLAGGVGGDMPALSVAAEFDVTIPLMLQKGNVSIVSGKPTLTNDLKGKRIGYAYGSISHYFLMELLQSTGIKEDKVKMIPMDVNQMASALHNREIDLFSAWEPSVSEAFKEHPDFFNSYKKITSGYLYFSKAFVENNPQISDLLLAAVIRAINWLKSDEENLLRACEWNLQEIEQLSGKPSSLTSSELAELAYNDILGYHSKYAIVINRKDLLLNGPLHKEFKFITSLNLARDDSLEDDSLKDDNHVEDNYLEHKRLKSDNWESDSWAHVADSFDTETVNNILDYPQKYQLNEYRYELE